MEGEIGIGGVFEKNCQIEGHSPHAPPIMGNPDMYIKNAIIVLNG